MAKKLVLKGCPFCGGKAYWHKGNNVWPDNVKCLECFAEIYGDKPMSALEAWNHRTADYYVAKNDRMVNIEGENL